LRDALRISIGTPAEMRELFTALAPLVGSLGASHAAKRA
jgi:histidinol-phosphate/aromatic aminotransferase/cobyric acid decarboxylase-like protein